MSDDKSPKKAILKLDGASCLSCKYAIEHIGRKFDGVSDVVVESGTSSVHIEYDGNDAAIDWIISVIKRLGYDAKLALKD